jgi:hypothetical protein
MICYRHVLIALTVKGKVNLSRYKFIEHHVMKAYRKGAVYLDGFFTPILVGG